MVGPRPHGPIFLHPWCYLFKTNLFLLGSRSPTPGIETSTDQKGGRRWEAGRLYRISDLVAGQLAHVEDDLDRCTGLTGIMQFLRTSPRVTFRIFILSFNTRIWSIWHIWARQIWSNGVSLKNLAKCSSEALDFRPIGPSSQKLWPNQFFGWFPHRNYFVKLQMGGPEKSIGPWIWNLAWSLVLPNQTHMQKIEA